MKDWCMEHPYLTFFMMMSAIATFGNVVTKMIDVFVKPAPTTVNMSIDPSKMPRFNFPESEDGNVH